MRSTFVATLAVTVALFASATPAAAQTFGVKGGLVVAELKTEPDAGDMLGHRQDGSAGRRWL